MALWQDRPGRALERLRRAGGGGPFARAPQPTPPSATQPEFNPTAQGAQPCPARRLLPTVDRHTGPTCIRARARLRAGGGARATRRELAGRSVVLLADGSGAHPEETRGGTDPTTAAGQTLLAEEGRVRRRSTEIGQDPARTATGTSASGLAVEASMPRLLRWGTAGTTVGEDLRLLEGARTVGIEVRPAPFSMAVLLVGRDGAARVRSVEAMSAFSRPQQC
jgi:hypothetical protein